MKQVINNGYFKGEIYISSASPSITDDVSAVDADVIDFINEYEDDCIIKCFGLTLGLEFQSKLDSTKANGLIDGAEEKWDWLLNGRETYIDSSGKTKRFKGLRFKSTKEADAPYDKSLLAYYTYFYYESNKFISTTGIGQSIPKAKNAEVVNPSFKAIKAWRKFYKLTVGEKHKPNVHQKIYGFGVDYSRANFETSLYDFIIDMNKLEENTYTDFQPKMWNNLNQFGI